MKRQNNTDAEIDRHARNMLLDSQLLLDGGQPFGVRVLLV